jgi:hypothetical protein
MIQDVYPGSSCFSIGSGSGTQGVKTALDPQHCSSYCSFISLFKVNDRYRCRTVILSVADAGFLSRIRVFPSRIPYPGS